MKISHIAYQPIPTLSELSERMQTLAALGYQGIELTASHPMPYPVKEIRTLCIRHRLPVVSLLSGWSYGHEGLCLCSRDAAVRSMAVRRLVEYAELAAQLNAVLVVGLMQGLRSDEPDESPAQARIADCLRQIAPAAEKLGATMAIEPVNHLQVGFNHTAAEAQALVQKVGSPALGFMLDTIHMNIEEASVVDTIREYGARIRHFHLCETNGGLFGTGNLNFSAVLAILGKVGYDRYVSVKIYRHAAWEEGARAAANFLRRLGVDMPAPA